MRLKNRWLPCDKDAAGATPFGSGGKMTYYRHVNSLKKTSRKMPHKVPAKIGM